MLSGYESAAEGWVTGPERVLYAPLAYVLVTECVPPLRDRTILDVGAGTGAVSRAAVAAGARVVATDVAFGMLAYDCGNRPPAVAADACALPFADDSIDGVFAAFLLNHLPDPTAALAEARRVVRPGGFAAASTFHAAWDHPVKRIVNEVAERFGYASPGWYRDLKRSHAPRAGDPVALETMARAAGLTGVRVADRVVDLGTADPHTLVCWRLGMAQLSAFLYTLTPRERRSLTETALARVNPASCRLAPRVLLLHGTVPVRWPSYR